MFASISAKLSVSVGVSCLLSIDLVFVVCLFVACFAYHQCVFYPYLCIYTPVPLIYVYTHM